MEVFYSQAVVVSRVDLVLQRWDPWCQDNLAACAGTWRRLWGLQISVGYEGQDPNSLEQCGAIVPEYPEPELVDGVLHDPVVKSVLCLGEIVGDRVRFLQTRRGEPLMISEVQIYGQYQESDWRNPITLGTF